MGEVVHWRDLPPTPSGSLKRGDNDGTSGGMEARIATLETHVGHIKNDLGDIKSDVREIKKDNRTDFRLLFAALIGVALGLAGLMARGFQWI